MCGDDSPPRAVAAGGEMLEGMPTARGGFPFALAVSRAPGALATGAGLRLALADQAGVAAGFRGWFGGHFWEVMW